MPVIPPKSELVWVMMREGGVTMVTLVMLPHWGSHGYTAPSRRPLLHLTTHLQLHPPPDTSYRHPSHTRQPPLLFSVLRRTPSNIRQSLVASNIFLCLSVIYYLHAASSYLLTLPARFAYV